MKYLGKKPPYANDSMNVLQGNQDQSEHYRNSLLELAEQLEIVGESSDFFGFLVDYAKNARKSAGEKVK